MRAPGRPSMKSILEEPYQEATGRELRDALLDWDDRGINATMMRRRILAATGHTIGRSTLMRLIDHYRSAQEPTQ
jgi:hypothetical protein